MSSSGDPVSNNPHTGPGGPPITGSNLTIGDGDNAVSIPLNHPGNINPYDVNPYASKLLGANQDLYHEFAGSATGNAFNHDLYSKMMTAQQTNIGTEMGNLYASRGLSGSSAEMGGISSAINQNQMAWLNREQGDQMQAMRGLSGLNQQNFGDIIGIQGQYGNFQDVYGQDVLGLLGLQQQQKMANQQMWGGLIGQGMGMPMQAMQFLPAIKAAGI